MHGGNVLPIPPYAFVCRNTCVDRVVVITTQRDYKYRRRASRLGITYE